MLFDFTLEKELKDKAGKVLALQRKGAKLIFPDFFNRISKHFINEVAEICYYSPPEEVESSRVIGNSLEFPITQKGTNVPMMRTRAKQKYVASDRARRENVPRHILF